MPVIPVHLGGVWGSIFSLDSRASLWRSIRKWPYPVTVAFGAPMHSPKAPEVRQVVSELAAEVGPSDIGSKETLGTRFIQTARRHWANRAMTDSTGRTLTYGESLTACLLYTSLLKY